GRPGSPSPRRRRPPAVTRCSRRSGWSTPTATGGRSSWSPRPRPTRAADPTASATRTWSAASCPPARRRLPRRRAERMTTTGPDGAAFITATYDQLARLGDSDLCCAPIELYRPDELALLPEEVLRLSSGCGHPVEDADISAGLTVLDIGSGAGADAILAARRTGPGGTVIGVDPSAAMRQRAARTAAELELPWVEFRAGTAENLPVGESSVDVVISNCVLSLSTDPTRAWTEIARILRPGGRIVVSDIVGGAATETVEAKTRCETGIEWPEYRALLTVLGFAAIRLVRVRA